MSLGLVSASHTVQTSIPLVGATELPASRLPTLSKPTRGGPPGSQFVWITEEEFSSVSNLVRGRVKLEDVNQVICGCISYMEFLLYYVRQW